MVPYILTLLGVLCLTSHNAAAQDQTPGFNIPPPLIASDVVEDLSVNFDDAFNTIENPYLSDTFKLNYQISLLEKMTARQSELLKISESYDALGIQFNEPPPSRGICEQLPVNAPCLQFYPELYPEIVAERTAYYESLIAEKNKATELEIREGESKEQAMARQRAEKAAKEAATRAKLAAEERKTRYLWTDITCLSGQCDGVLIATRATGFRASVKRGTRLPDGTIVQDIDMRGITVVIDGQPITVRPAPAETAEGTLSGTEALAATLGLASPSSRSGFSAQTNDTSGSSGGTIQATNISSAGSNSMGGNGGNSSTSVSTASTNNGGSISTDENSAGAGGQTVVEPALGPSGLF